LADVKIEGFDHIIREAVQKRIEASIAESLESERHAIVEAVVHVALNAKVKDGYKEIPFIEKLARDEIQTATRDAVVGWVQSIKPDIQAEVEKLLATKKAQKELAAAMLGQLVGIADKPNWRINVGFEVPEA